MISHISIRDFAIIRDLELDLYPGLNMITGETGAGKSVIIEAVSMALGARADVDYIRSGCERALLTVVIDRDGADIGALLEEEGIPDDDPLIVRREISAKGKSLCRVGGSIVPLSSLARVTKRLVDIHGQYDHQSLLDPSRHLDVLDLYGGTEIARLRGMTKEFCEEYFAASSELMKLRRALSDTAREKELLTHELEEIEAAGVREGECEELEAGIRIMQNSEKIFEAVSIAYEEIYGGEFSAESNLGHALSSLQSVADYSDDLKEASDSLENAYYQVDELRQTLRRLRDGVSYSQHDLDESIERLELLNALKRKFGGSEASVLAYAKNATEKLGSIEHADEHMAELEAAISHAREKYDAAAARLSALRKEAASRLKTDVEKELADLSFQGAQFGVRFRESEVSPDGSDDVEFLISTNPGEEMKPLVKVASGGELSRIMLALKRITGDLDAIPTLIFDEIDTGISGATAGVVGEKLRSIAQGRQIVCITHLPQIAAMGDHHYKIEKQHDEISTHTTVIPLSAEERVEELARLLSGTVISEAARDQARELLKGGQA